jgi:ubiquinone/menaquinone biosynthesis C-methylase UbiE
MVSPKYFSSKLKITVDFGEDTSATYNYATETIKKFSSLVDALNYMAKNGWQVVNGYTVVSTKTAFTEQHFLMKKMVR